MAGYAPSGFFVLRTPRLPLALESPNAERLERPEVRDALEAASPGLAAAIATASPGDLGTRLSLARYLARMSGRPTPRGMLAGVSVGYLGDAARLRIADARPVSRLSTAAATVIGRRLADDPCLRDRLRYHPNPWLYAAGPGRLRYVETRPDSGHALVAADATEEVMATLGRALDGARLPELAAALVEDGAANARDARAFVDELADAGMLVCELVVPMCGPEPGHHLMDRLRVLAPGSLDLRALEELHDAMAAADRGPAGSRSTALAAARGPAISLGVGGAAAELLQVDLLRAAPGLALPRGMAEELLEALEVLRRLARPDEPEELTQFRDAFRERHGERRVPLLVALDGQTGVGFGREAMRPHPPVTGVPWGATERLMLRLLTGAIASGAREVDLGPAVPGLAARPAAPLPDAFAILAAVAAESEAAVTGGAYEVRLMGAFGPSGARLLGRFCHADDELRELAQGHLRSEEALQPDAIFAELAHLPDVSVGDLLVRPRLRAHELVLLAGTHASGEGRITPAELTLGLEDDELVLRRADGRRVLPRLTSAHDIFGPGLELYRFLALMQFQGVPPGISWSWGPLDTAPFLPRIRLGRVVLALARWRIAPAELKEMRAGDAGARAAAVAGWRRRSGCPRFVGLPVQESALPLDLDDQLGAEILLREAPADGHATVQEWWPAPDRSPVTGPGGRYAHELVLPFVSTRAPTRDRPRPAPGRVPRSRPPGSDWLYVKLYTAPETADALIVEELASLARAMVASGSARGWHFLRYADPEFHVRLRLQGEPDVLRHDVLGAVLELGERLLATGAVHRVALDTYEREVERYGGARAIDLAEHAFHADSEAVADLLAGLPRDDATAAERWRLAAAGVWTLLLALGLDEGAAAQLVARTRGRFTAEQDLDRAGVRALARGLRTARPALEELLQTPPGPLVERTAHLAIVGREIEALARTGGLCRTPVEIAASLAHMHCNRLLRHSPRPQEFVIHDALSRLAAGRDARARAAEPVT